MSGTALVTGSEGFVGRLLCRRLAEAGWNVRGVDRHVSPGTPRSVACDLTDPAQVDELLEATPSPTHIFHLAGLTYVPESIEHPWQAMEANVAGTIHLARALIRRVPGARLLHVSTSEVYGPPLRLPVDEAHPLAPANPYSISKAAAEQYCGFLAARGELEIIRLRPFNHSGPGQSPRFVLSSFARQIAEIETGRAQPVLRVGNLSAARDFSHVQDVLDAYEAVATRGHAGEVYNICSGRSRTIQQAVDRLLAQARVPIDVAVDPDRYRPEIVPEVCGSHQKLTRDTGWEPPARVRGAAHRDSRPLAGRIRRRCLRSPCELGLPALEWRLVRAAPHNPYIPIVSWEAPGIWLRSMSLIK